MQAISALGRSDIFLKLEIIKKIMGLIIILVSMQISPMVMAISLVVNDLLSTVINAAPNRKLLNYTYFEQIKDIFPSFVMATIMGVVIYPIAFIGLSNILTVVLQLIIGMVGYITLSVITKHPSFIYLFRLIRR